VPCLGASGAIFAACAALLAPGDGVLVETPVYEPLWRIPAALGANLSYSRRLRDQGYALDPSRIVAALDAGTKLVIVTNPHNPSAALTDDRALAELAGELAKRDVRLLVDEAYLELYRPAATARGLGPNVLTCSSATKCWGVPWARAGWLIVPSEIAQRLSYVERHVVGAAPPACWAFGERAVRRADQLLARASELQRHNRALVDRFMARVGPGLSWHPPPPESVFGWVESTTGGGLDSDLERARTSQGVLVAPGRFFGNPGAFRVSWVSPADRLEHALESLARAVCVDYETPARTTTATTSWTIQPSATKNTTHCTASSPSSKQRIRS
jgi:aspartate/methionine/tyrosine aminotransferase